MCTHPLIDRWLDRLAAADIEGLADLYHPDGRLDTNSESWQGRDEIADGLLTHRKFLRSLRVDGVQALSVQDTGITFETRLRSLFGPAALRHHWTMTGDAIQAHRIEATT